MARQTGVVKCWPQNYGFIIPDDGSGDIFCHEISIVKQIDVVGYRKLRKGEKVEFEIGMSTEYEHKDKRAV